MSIPTLPLWQPGEEPFAAGDFEPFLELYLHPGGGTRGAVIVCPGGGYAGRADYEGGPIAERYVAAGLHAFVLQYRVVPARHPAPLRDAARSIRLVRAHAEQWGVLPGHIAICGFSAGGHLAASLGVFYDRPWVEGPGELDLLSARPDACIPCYAVISGGPNREQGSFNSLLGEENTEERRRELSLELHVTPQTPPAFIWHTADDAVVPVQNALLFADALATAKVPFELHVYPHGPHGMAIAAGDPHVASWMPLSIDWLRGLGW